MQGFYPEFESGQVLTNAHLNQLASWLNQQQQATRRKLLGIGIVCGLEATRSGSRLRVGRGVALTSLGHLICQDDDREYGRYRPYGLPLGTVMDEDPDALIQDLPVLLPDSGIALWELLTDAAAPAPGEAPFQTLDATFLAGKALLLLLEVRREALQNCDINDCSNKGARWVHTVRTLLLREEDAQALWEGETAGAAWPQPRGQDWRELRAGLEAVSMPRLPLAAQGAGSLQEIHQLAVSQVQIGWQRLREQLERGFKTYGHLLRERFPDEAFPQGPWQGLNPLPPAAELSDVLLSLHHYDLLRDALASWREFLEAACCHDALCCPDPGRFPYHVLLGIPQAAPAAQAPDGRRQEEIDFGIGAQAEPALLRHPFYPAPPLRLQAQHANAMLDLYYRSWLLFQRYRGKDLLKSELRITPSRQHGPLSYKAIPYYLALRPGDDLHRNWHPQATRCGLLGQVRGHALATAPGHPLAQVPDESDFYRIEGLLGRPLGQVLASLKSQQRQLGIGFGIEPVFLPLRKIDGDEQRNQLLALLLRNQTLQRLFSCKLRDLDVLFLLLLGFVFQVLVAVLYLFGRLNPAGALTTGGATAGTRLRINTAMLVAGNLDFEHALNTGDGSKLQAVVGKLGSGTLTTFLHRQLREGRLQAVDLLDTLDEPDDHKGPSTLLYRKVQNQAGGDLLQRVRRVLADQGADPGEQQVQQAYYSVRLLQSAEALLQQSAANSVAQFDFDRFDTEMSDLQSNWQGYRQVLATSNANGAMQAALDSHLSLLANLGGSALLSNLRSEFNKREQKIFSEFLFDGYLARCPGLEHLCGVPKGGTLVLAYTHRSLLQEGDKGMASVGAALGDLMVGQPTAGLAVASAASEPRLQAASAAEALARAKAAAEAASARRSLQEAEQAKREEALRADEQTLVAARKQVANSSKAFEKLQLQRDRLASNTAASAAEKRSATNSVKAAETQLKKESEAFSALEKRAESARQQLEKASAAVSDAKRAEAQAQSELKRAEAEAQRAEEAARLAEPESAAGQALGDSALLRASQAANGDLLAPLAADDPLNDLVVVADFCLPTYCCDSDCAELLAPAPEEASREPPNRAVTVNGRIVSASAALNRLADSRVLADAQLQVRAQDGGEIAVKMAKGAFLFKVNPGSYTLIASAKGHTPREETLKIQGPPGQDLIIALQRG